MTKPMTKLEEVARAIEPAAWADGRFHEAIKNRWLRQKSLDQARAVIRELMAMTPEMTEAAKVRCHGVYEPSTHRSPCGMYLGDTGASSFQRALQAVLDEKP